MSDLSSMFKVSMPAVVVAALISAAGTWLARPAPASVPDPLLAQITAMRQEIAGAQITQRLDHLDQEISDVRVAVQFLQRGDRAPNSRAPAPNP